MRGGEEDRRGRTRAGTWGKESFDIAQHTTGGDAGVLPLVAGKLVHPRLARVKVPAQHGIDESVGEQVEELGLSHWVLCKHAQATLAARHLGDPGVHVNLFACYVRDDRVVLIAGRKRTPHGGHSKTEIESMSPLSPLEALLIGALDLPAAGP